MPTKSTTRTTISLPAELKERMERDGAVINWSAEAAECFERVLGELAARKTQKDLEDVVSRLRATRIDETNESYGFGRERGTRWAENAATYSQLERAAGIELGGQPMAPWGSKELAAFAILGLRQDTTPNHELAEASDEFWQAALGDAPSAVDTDMLDGFLDGARAIWEQVEEMV